MNAPAALVRTRVSVTICSTLTRALVLRVTKERDVKQVSGLDHRLVKDCKRRAFLVPDENLCLKVLRLAGQ